MGGGVHHHKRVTTALNKQIQQQKTKLEEVRISIIIYAMDYEVKLLNI